MFLFYNLSYTPKSNKITLKDGNLMWNILMNYKTIFENGCFTLRSHEQFCTSSFWPLTSALNILFNYSQTDVKLYICGFYLHCLWCAMILNIFSLLTCDLFICFQDLPLYKDVRTSPPIFVHGRVQQTNDYWSIRKFSCSIKWMALLLIIRNLFHLYNINYMHVFRDEHLFWI